MKKLFVAILMALPLLGYSQQTHYSSVLDKVVESNPSLRSALTLSTAQQQEARAGLLIENPSIEGAYYLGSPAEVGKRWDLSISQSFDMPSVLIRKARIRSLQENAAVLGYAYTRNRLLYETQSVCADLIYYRAVARLQESRNTLASGLVDLYSKRLEAGDCSILDYNRVQMNKADAERAAVESILFASHTNNQLLILVGDKNFSFEQEVYEEVELPASFGEWYRQFEMLNPELQLLDNEVEVSSQEATLSKAEWLPEMSLGYASENTVGEVFRGVKVGLTLPIWSQPRTIKAAKLKAQAATEELEARRTALYQEQECLFHHLYTTKKSLDGLRESFRLFGSTELLAKALESGEIELENYLQQLDAYYDVQLQILELSRQCEQLWLQLNAPKL